MNSLSIKHTMLFIAGFLALFAAFYNASLPLYIDEAYYWLWTNHLALGYYDHPPMIAYMIKIFTVFGDSVWQIRLVNIFCYFGAAFFIYKTAKYLFDEQTAFYAFLIFILSPAVTMGLTITTPDSPLIFFWAASLYFAAKAFMEEKAIDFILAGFLGGLALLSKYTAILLLLSYFLFILFKNKKLFVSSKPYLAILFGIIAFMPVIIWNFQNEFISFTFQYAHGSAHSEQPINWFNNLEFFGGMFGIFNPIFFTLLLYMLFSKESYKDKKLFFVILPTLFIILFFLYKGVYKKMELNWVAPAFISACIAVAYLISKKNMRKTLYIGLALSLVLMMVIRFPLAFGLEGKKNPHNRLFGYEEVAHHIQPLAGESVFADHLTLASSLTYYLKKDVYIPTKTRKSQFDWWQKGIDFSQTKGIYVSKSDRLDELKTIWKHAELLEIYTAQKKGYSDKQFYIYRVSN